MNSNYHPGKIHYKKVHDDVIKWKQFPRYWPLVRGIHRSPVNSPHKGQWRGALMFSLIYACSNGWANKRDGCDLRRYRTHYDVIVMWYSENWKQRGINELNHNSGWLIKLCDLARILNIMWFIYHRNNHMVINWMFRKWHKIETIATIQHHFSDVVNNIVIGMSYISITKL